MTRFRPTSDVGRVNLGAWRDGVPVSLKTARVLAASVDWASVSHGRFDSASGATPELWDVIHRHEPARGADIHRLASHGLWRTVDVDLRR